jgi:hypothetical protein
MRFLLIALSMLALATGSASAYVNGQYGGQNQCTTTCYGNQCTTRCY